MKKLSESDYRLPTIEALASFDILESGTTEPMRIRGVDKTTGERGQFVVKFKNANRMSPLSSCFELLGAWIAKELDIKTVEPVLVNISQEFIKTISGKHGYQSALKSPGFNFGSAYEEGFFILPVSNFTWSETLTEQAKMIFMFDMFIANADRGAGKPNVLTNSESLMVFDHEMAFTFTRIMPFMRNLTPWIFGDSEREMYERHYFYNLLRNTNCDFSEQVQSLARLNDSFWSNALRWIPTEWQTNEISDIRNYLASLIQYRNTFAEQLTKILSL